MFRNDRKVAKAILKLTGKDYDVKVLHRNGSSDLVVDYGGSESVHVPLSPSEIQLSVLRLVTQEFLILDYIDINRGLHFSITDKLVHRFAFAFDEFRFKFIEGYIAGLATAAVAWSISRLPHLFRSILSLLK